MLLGDDVAGVLHRVGRHDEAVVADRVSGVEVTLEGDPRDHVADEMTSIGRPVDADDMDPGLAVAGGRELDHGVPSVSLR